MKILKYLFQFKWKICIFDFPNNSLIKCSATLWVLFYLVNWSKQTKFQPFVFIAFQLPHFKGIVVYCLIGVETCSSIKKSSKQHCHKVMFFFFSIAAWWQRNLKAIHWFLLEASAAKCLPWETDLQWYHLGRRGRLCNFSQLSKWQCSSIIWILQLRSKKKVT